MHIKASPLSDWQGFLCYTGADRCGERLAWMLGITSPKYQYAIDEYHRIQKEVGSLQCSAKEPKMATFV